MYQIDLNCDMGESFGAYTIGNDREIVKYVSSANIACGFHAADPVVMHRTVDAAQAAGVHIGAHPGFPDLMGFGRRKLEVSPAEAADYVLYQTGALTAFAGKLSHVKLHGALYNMASKDLAMSLAICKALKKFDSELVLLALSGSAMIEAAKQTGMRYASEVFADRAYQDDGSLVPRQCEGAVIHDSALAVERVIGMVKNRTVESINGKLIPIQADSVCVHGDNAEALEFVRLLRAAFERENIAVKGL